MDRSCLSENLPSINARFSKNVKVALKIRKNREKDEKTVDHLQIQNAFGINNYSKFLYFSFFNYADFFTIIGRLKFSNAGETSKS